MRSSDRAWIALAGGVTAYDLIAPDDEQLTSGPPVLQVSADCHRVDDFGYSPASRRRHTAVVRSDHADVRRVSAAAAAVLPSPNNRTAGQPGGCDGRAHVCCVKRGSRPA
jgi:hypothetical protein